MIRLLFNSRIDKLSTMMLYRKIELIGKIRYSNDEPSKFKSLLRIHFDEAHIHGQTTSVENLEKIGTAE